MPVKKQLPGIENYLRKVFAIMFGAIGLTAISSFLTLAFGIEIAINFQTGGFTPLYYIALFGGLGLSIYAQVRAFSMSPQMGGLLLAIYSILIGFVITPLVAVAIAVNPVSILQAFIIAALMFGSMALFGYKTTKDLGFLGIFLFIGMIGLILVGLFSFIWPLGSTFATIVSLIGVLIFALFTAYDMQFQKKAYTQVAQSGDEKVANQLAVLGALHLYISFIAMFQYLLSLLNMRR